MPTSVWPPATDAEETARLRAQIAAEMPDMATINATHRGANYGVPSCTRP